MTLFEVITKIPVRTFDTWIAYFFIIICNSKHREPLAISIETRSSHRHSLELRLRYKRHNCINFSFIKLFDVI